MEQRYVKMKTRKKRRVTCSADARKEIAQLLGCSAPTVTSALCANRNSALAHRIRLEAIKRGGHELIVAPIDRAWEDDGEVMRQYYPNDVEIVIDKRDAIIYVLMSGEPIETAANAGISDLVWAQKQALKASSRKEEASA